MASFAWLRRVRSGIAGFSAASLLWYLGLRIVFVDPIYWGVSVGATPPGPRAVLILAAGVLAAWLAPPEFCRRSAWFLAAAAAGALIFPTSVFAVLAAVAALAVAAGEFAASLPESFWERFRFPKFTWRAADRVALAGWVLAAVWSFLVQRHAFRSLYLLWQDWCQYGEHYLRIATGVASARDFFVAAGHWNPLANCLMGGALAVYPVPETIFAVNAAALASAGPLCYLLAKRRGFFPVPALLFGFCAWANPVLYNQSAQFYGFHPVNLLVPLILGFFICRERRPGWAACFAVLTLLVQETAAAFWCGYGLWLLLFPGEGGKRRRMTGAAVVLGAIAFFVLVSAAVMPKLLGVAGYSQNFHYAPLGDSAGAIALSPFLRPRAFWAVLSQQQNLAFLLALAIPVLAAFAFAPSCFAVAALPLAAAVAMQGSPEIKNLFQQYGLEITLILLVAALFGAAKRLSAGRSELFRGALAAMTTASLLMFAHFGVGCLLAPRALMRRPDAEKMISFLREKLPPAGSGSRLLAPQRLRGHFAFERPVGAPGDLRRPGDMVLIDLDEIDRELPALRKKLITDPRTVPVTHLNWYGRHLVLYEVAPQAVPDRLNLPFLIYCQIGKPWPGLPFPVRAPEGVEVHLLPDRSRLFLRLRWPVKTDLSVKVLVLLEEGRCETRIYPFAHGVIPADIVGPGMVFVLEPGGKVLAAEVVPR